MERKSKAKRRSHQIKPGNAPRPKIARGPVRPSGAGTHGGNATQKNRRARKEARQSLRRGDWT